MANLHPRIKTCVKGLISEPYLLIRRGILKYFDPVAPLTTDFGFNVTRTFPSSVNPPSEFELTPASVTGFYKCRQELSLLNFSSVVPVIEEIVSGTDPERLVGDGGLCVCVCVCV